MWWPPAGRCVAVAARRTSFTQCVVICVPYTRTGTGVSGPKKKFFQIRMAWPMWHKNSSSFIHSFMHSFIHIHLLWLCACFSNQSTVPKQLLSSKTLTGRNGGISLLFSYNLTPPLFTFLSFFLSYFFHPLCSRAHHRTMLLF